MPTTLTPDTFRAAMPAFQNDALYTDDAIQMYLTMSSSMFNEERWEDLLDRGVALWTAHNLVMDARDADAAFVGGLPGESNGLISSKAIDRVSVSYDTSAAMLPNAGSYALTTFGQRYLQLVQVVGMGYLGAV